MPSSSKPPSYSSTLHEQYEKKNLSHSTSHGKSENKRDKKIRSADSVSCCDSVASDVLRTIAGDKIRRARCAPAFLQQVARSGEIESLDKSNRKVQLIDGPEATKFYERYLSEHSAGVNKIERSKSDGDLPLPESNPAVVFAVTALDAGRKVVDYYMTWRGKKDPTHHLRGPDRRHSMLDSEFKDVARTLDRAFRRRLSLRSAVSAPSSSRHAENKRSRTESKSKSKSHKTSPLSPTDPSTESSTQHAAKPAEIPSVILADSPAEARSSVVSLPLLNMVRGVPFSHRMTLRVTNPDAASILSSSASANNVNVGETIFEEPLPIEADQALPNLERPPTPASVAPSSATDETNAETLASEKLTIPSRTSSEPSRHSHHHGNRHKSDGSSSKHSRRSRKDSDSSSIDIVIVLLEEDVDAKSDDTWHGLERRPSKVPVRKPSQTASPWSGPLAHADGQTYRSPTRLAVIDSDDSDSSDDEWKDSPVVPLGSLMAALSSTSEIPVGFLSPVPTIKYPNTPSMMGSPAPPVQHMVYSSPYVPATPPQVSSPYTPAASLQVFSPYTAPTSPHVSSPYAPATPLASSPYIPVWGTPLATPLSPLPRSNSRTNSIVSYHSPYTPSY